MLLTVFNSPGRYDFHAALGADSGVNVVLLVVTHFTLIFMQKFLKKRKSYKEGDVFSLNGSKVLL